MTDSGTDGQPAAPANSDANANPARFASPELPPGGSQAMQVQISTHQGPLPPPQILAAYELVHPGSAAWVLKEAEAEAAHVRNMEHLALSYQARDALLHRILPFTLVATLLIISAILGVFANAVLGGVAFLSTLAGVVIIYLNATLGGEKKSMPQSAGSELPGPQPSSPDPK